MKYVFNVNVLFLLLVLTLQAGCKKDTQWKGQAPIRKVNTNTVPIQLQSKGILDLGSGVYCSNDFDGARMNGAVFTDDTLLTVLITPENTPINESPWYAFKVWAETKREIYIKLTYLQGVKHRYYPKLSADGMIWENLDSTKYTYDGLTINEESGKEMAEKMIIQVEIGPDTLWIAAQELITSKHVISWVSGLSARPFINQYQVGESRNGKPISMLQIGNSDDQKMMIILSRQHPPEVTGYLAMKSFVETISNDSELSVQFRNKYNTYVIPMVNPDGADLGHWRHNAGGIDLNRDWEDFNQPEVASLRAFMQKKIAESGGQFIVGIDFHSTWEDIYYTIDPALKGNMPGVIPEMIANVGKSFSDYEPNVRPDDGKNARVSSTSLFFYEFGAESLTYEVGDNTPRTFLQQKGETTAIELMKLMLE